MTKTRRISYKYVFLSAIALSVCVFVFANLYTTQKPVIGKTVISGLQPNSEVQISEYVYRPAEKESPNYDSDKPYYPDLQTKTVLTDNAGVDRKSVV